MEKIVLSDSYYIDVQPMNFVLHWLHEAEHPKTKEVRIVDSIDGYYGTLPQALEYYIRKLQERTLTFVVGTRDINVSEAIRIIEDCNRRAVEDLQRCLKENANDNS